MFFGRLVGHLNRWALISALLVLPTASSATSKVLDIAPIVPDYVTRYGMYLDRS